ncbi:Lanthionine synthetase C-like protein [Parafrankia irregularis]|uniref:Lanthionine synthetase C-like protein n=1 Tax=Parafrankia irregularis TaxID=795642 RepID=A0A0S4QHN1_9ACTN|nr:MULTISPECIES: lanthionine synthetase C family protein [Parafrankia]MBE3204151.1 lanthionine synthetase C family protein [Parafrankia sp. CH37]CUU54973.1 Lanthionine synthetase C-like protein [Parafrankia irregularis]
MTSPTINADQAAAQSLAHGAAGLALLRVELALTGSGTWQDAHDALVLATSEPVDGSPSGCLVHGAPALRFVLHTAAADGQPRYAPAASALDHHLHRITRGRLDAARNRMADGAPGTFGEYDLFYGLTGLGLILLRTAPANDTLADILTYLTRLATRPLPLDGLQAPGWWAARDPDPLSPTPGGHANLGMAHGAAGILAFLALAARRGRTVEGQQDAIKILCAWFDRWQQHSDDGPWWPQWLSRKDLRAGYPAQLSAGRPSWCYGTPGIARALQLAGIATADPARQAAAEHALAHCLAGPQLARLPDAGLCHGLAGVYQTAVRAAADAITPGLSTHLAEVAAGLRRQAAISDGTPALLTGDTGVRLVLETARRTAPPVSGWDSCLLLT